MSEQLLHSGYAFDLYSTSWIDSSGEVFERDIVRHRGAVAIVPLTDDQAHVLLVRQFRTPLNAWLLELPAGLRDKEGESEFETARRELEEEVGCVSETLEHLVTLATAVGFTDEAISIFLARGLTWTTRRADGVEEESMTVEKIPLADVGGMIADGEITDAKTVAGLLLAQQKLALRSDG
ncbi:MAG: NUDIX hydrolase [Actinomycetota bacterium]|nr:NUDIX hydrolase [Acidimicrobiales bacterium]MEC7874583.1 NUDIX hydrolase [Actinomycetota bacterium]MEC8828136.1 NUDIX hydrolase [Actinomycetota bacterium]MED6304065.1 NUDIX hydrolase [Actinomycetota bacterium]